MPEILLNPGPVVLSERVRHAMLRPDLCHRETEFAELQNSIRHDLLNVYPLPEDKSQHNRRRQQSHPHRSR